MMMFAYYDEPTGIPIGNLLSQIYALIYMNSVDHYIVRELSPDYYCRYVDDFILFNLTRNQALLYREKIKIFLVGIKLELSRSSIAHTKKGVNFCGFRTWRSARFIRKYSLYKGRKSVRLNNIVSFVSCLAHASKTCSLQNLLTYAMENNNELYRKIPKIYHQRHLSSDKCKR